MLVNNSIQCQMSDYTKAMNALINEKKELTSDQIQSKKEKAIQLAQSVFSIKGDQEFKELAHSLIEKMCEVKPGRKLVKALSKNMKNKIIIENGLKAEFSPNNNTITISKSIVKDCQAIRNHEIVVTVRPLEVIFAHECIHALHASLYDLPTKTKKDILPDMDDLEEQHTITGYSRHFAEKNSINKYDVLSENAFLLAMNLLPSINHRNQCDTKKIVVNQANENEPTYYFEWLEGALNLIGKLPPDKTEDENYILTYLRKWPAAINSISDKLKNEEFYHKVLMELDLDIIIDHLPELRTNKEFIKQAMKKHALAFFIASSELWKDKEFVIYTLNQSKKIKEYFKHLIDSELINDPEIQALL
jgi:hypothetical protein